MAAIHIPTERGIMCNHETWKPIIDHDGYEVSNLGRVRSLPRTITMRNGTPRPVAGGVLANRKNTNGYMRVHIAGHDQSVHRLVAAAFIGPDTIGLDVCHYDGDPANNDLCNLRYDTRKGNMADQKRHGTHAKRQRTLCPRGHALADFNLRADAARQGLRKCRACNHALKALEQGRITVADVQSASDDAYDQYREFGSIGRRRPMPPRIRVAATHCQRGHRLDAGNLVDDSRCRGCRWAMRTISRGGVVADAQLLSDWAAEQYLAGHVGRLRAPSHLQAHSCSSAA